MRKMEAIQFKRQIEVLSTFLPNEIINMKLTDLHEPQHFVAVLLAGDISGVITASENYCKAGNGGVHRLTAILNCYFGCIVEVVHFYGGDVIRFSCDAFLAIWKAAPNVCLYRIVHEVVVCALFIQQDLKRIDNLKLKLTIACGGVTFCVIGDENVKDFVISGLAVEDLEEAKRYSSAQDVVVAPTAWGHIAEDSYEVVDVSGGCVKVLRCIYQAPQDARKLEYEKKRLAVLQLCQTHVEHRKIDRAFNNLEFYRSLPERREVVNALNRWSLNDMRPFISKAVLEQIDLLQPLEHLTEIREVTIQFISVLRSKLTVNIFEIICDIVSNFAGIVNGVCVLGSSVKIFAIFGLSLIKEGMESQHALKSAHRIRKALSKLNVSVGVTNGLVYCGVVGHPYRKAFFVIGSAINKAVKMIRTFPQRVSCDHHTYKQSKLPSSNFQDLNLSKCDFGVVMEYNEDLKEKVPVEQNLPILLGRDAEMELVQLVVNEPEMAQNYRAICFHGKSKIGKTRLLKEALSRCLDSNHIVAYMNLCGRTQRPYFCVSFLYRQLYDAVAKKESALNVSREVWDLNEVLQANKVERKDIAIKRLLKISALSGGVTVLLVDNVQYIDAQSYEIIVAILKEGNVRFLCGGQFEEDTWDVRWKMSLNKDIKVLELRPLPSNFFPDLFCQFLNVKGVDKKLLKLLEDTKETCPGFLQIRLKTLVKAGEIETKHVFENEFSEHRFVFTKHEECAIPVAKLTSQGVLMDYDLPSSTITMQLYNSFTTFEQLVVRTAAAIGEVFCRKLLLAVLGNPKEECFIETIRHFFEEDIFDCATKYIKYGGLVDNTKRCLCADPKRQIDRCAYCKLIYFKDRNLRVEVYNLLLASERKELHLKVTDHLETLEKSCPKCIRSDFSTIVKLETFKDFVRCNTIKEIDEFECEHNVSEKGGGDFAHTKKTVKIPSYCCKNWEPLTCFCLELLFKTYSDLVYHSQAANHLGKQIFFVMQYGIILVTLKENKEAIKHLTDAVELCILAKGASTTLDSKLKKSLFAKIHLLLAEAHLNLENIETAKKHVVSGLMQHSIRMPSFSKRNFFVKAIEIFVPKSDVVLCVSVLSKIFAAEGQWHAAKAASSRSLKLLRKTGGDIKISCDVYRSAMEILGASGDNSVCKKLEKGVRCEVLRKFVGNFMVDFYAMSDLMNVIFNLQILKGRLNRSLKMGLRALELDQHLQASQSLFRLIPTLATLLLFARKIEDAVTVMKTLRNQTKTQECIVAYYAFCVELNNETSLILEPIDKCLKFLAEHFREASKEPLTSLEIKLLVNSTCYFLRNRRWHQAEKWNILHNFDSIDPQSFTTTLNFIRATECSLLLLVHEMETRKNFMDAEEERIAYLIKICEEAAKEWRVLIPRVLHLKAYFYQLISHYAKAKRLLKKALDMAKRQGNILECCWIKLDRCVWGGGFSFGNDVKNIDWKLEKRYTAEQWSQIMFSLPLGASC